jgi:hypothetical protein
MAKLKLHKTTIARAKAAASKARAKKKAASQAKREDFSQAAARMVRGATKD